MFGPNALTSLGRILPSLGRMLPGLALLSGSAVAQQKSLTEQLIGAWTLSSFYRECPDGNKSDVSQICVQQTAGWHGGRKQGGGSRNISFLLREVLGRRDAQHGHVSYRTERIS
jgi:hypothetical protein